MRHIRRLQALEDKAALRYAWRNETAGGNSLGAELLHARLDAIGQRLRIAGVVLEIDPDEIRQRLIDVRVEMQRLAAQRQ